MRLVHRRAPRLLASRDLLALGLTLLGHLALSGIHVRPLVVFAGPVTRRTGPEVLKWFRTRPDRGKYTGL